MTDARTDLPTREETLERLARAIYEADREGGYDADDPRTYWMAPDGYWPPATKMFVWDAWRDIARATMSAFTLLDLAAEMQRRGVVVATIPHPFREGLFLQVTGIIPAPQQEDTAE